MSDRLIQNLDGFTRLVATLDACDPQSLPKEALIIFNLAQAARYQTAAILNTIDLGKDGFRLHPSGPRGRDLNSVEFSVEKDSFPVGEIYRPSQSVYSSGPPISLVLNPGFSIGNGRRCLGQYIYAQGNNFSVLGFTERRGIRGLFHSDQTGPVIGKVALSSGMESLNTVIGFQLINGEIGEQVIEDFMPTT